MSESPGHQPGPRALAVLLAAQFVTPLSIAGVAIALPSVSQDLGADPELLQGAVNAFNLTFAICTLVWGVVSDRIGHSRTFALGVATCLVASVGSAVSPDLVMLDLVRAIAGVGAAAVITGATAVISRAWTGRGRAAAFAAFGTVNGLGLAFGPSISGALLSVGSWRGIFVVHAVVLAVALAFCRTHLPRIAAPAPPGAVDGAAVTDGRDGRALLHPGFVATTLVPVAGAAGFVTLLTYVPSALQAVRGMGPGAAGIVMLAMTVPVLVSPVLVDRVVGGRGPSGQRVVLLVALACLVVAPLLMAGVDAGTPLLLVLVALVLAGCGFGLPLGIVDARALAFVPVARQGSAAGVLNFFRIGSEALFVAAYAAALTAMVRRAPEAAGHEAEIASGQPGHASVYADAMHPVMLGLAACCAVALAAFVVLDRAAGYRTSPVAGRASAGASSSGPHSGPATSPARGSRSRT
ncbi:MFS transporter [Janibacter sp. G368]|uniref:MFS transporter n=1 Tax=Janibacter sp. G368 TaxID=3420441 RepID=UPI003D0484E2